VNVSFGALLRSRRRALRGIGVGEPVQVVGERLFHDQSLPARGPRFADRDALDCFAVEQLNETGPAQ